MKYLLAISILLLGACTPLTKAEEDSWLAENYPQGNLDIEIHDAK